jgi:hypothetical protein
MTNKAIITNVNVKFSKQITPGGHLDMLLYIIK